MHRPYLTEAAETDLEEIGDRIALDSPPAAERLLDRLRDGCLQIATMPLRFSRVPRFEHREIRRMVVGNYLIFFRVRGDEAMILRIMHGARDYDVLLFSDETDDD